MSFRSFLSDRRAGFIRRWHAVQTHHEETLAEHHFFVLHDALVIMDALRYYGILEKLGMEEPNEIQVLLMAHFHDAPEFESGDVSGAAKHDFPSLAREVHQVERQITDNVLFRDLPDEIAERYRDFVREMISENYVTLEQQICRYADKLEALLFAEAEISIGNAPMADMVQRVQEELDELKWPWLVELRKAAGVP